MKKLSIVVLFCDKDYQYFDRCIETIYHNVKIPFEVIGICNCTKYYEIKNYHNVKIIYPNKGFNTRQLFSRIYSSKFVTGDYIWFVDVDDYALEIREDFIKDIDSDIIYFNNNSSTNEYISKKEIIFENKEEKGDLLYLINKISIVNWDKFYKTEVFKKATCEVDDSRVSSGEDLLLVSLMLKNSKTLYYSKEYIYHYNDDISIAANYLDTKEKLEYLIKGSFSLSILLRKLFTESEYNTYFANVYNNQLSYFINNIIKSDKDDYEKIILLKSLQSEFSKTNIVEKTIPVVFEDKEFIDLFLNEFTKEEINHDKIEIENNHLLNFVTLLNPKEIEVFKICEKSWKENFTFPKDTKFIMIVDTQDTNFKYEGLFDWEIHINDYCLFSNAWFRSQLLKLSSYRFSDSKFNFMLADDIYADKKLNIEEELFKDGKSFIYEIDSFFTKSSAFFKKIGLNFDFGYSNTADESGLYIWNNSVLKYIYENYLNNFIYIFSNSEIYDFFNTTCANDARIYLNFYKSLLLNESIEECHIIKKHTENPLFSNYKVFFDRELADYNKKMFHVILGTFEDKIEVFNSFRFPKDYVKKSQHHYQSEC